MAAIVCHGLQSCLESQLAEPRMHRLRLPSPKPKPLTPPQPQPIDSAFKSCFWEQNTKPSHCEGNNYKTDTANNINHNQGGWSFIQALSDVTKEPSDKETTYVHPQAKQSSLLRLSPRSLELCTENLGNETGTDITESGIDDLLTSDSSGLGTREQRVSSRQVLGDKKKKTKAQNFPPPLTTIRGTESLRVRPHREGGRLVIEVTRAPSTASCFHAERSHGRLRLCFLENPNPPFDSEEDENEVIEEVFESEVNGQRQDVQEKEEKEEEEEEKVEETEEEGVENGDGERDAYEILMMMRMEKHETERGSRRNSGRSRCKEGGEHVMMMRMEKHETERGRRRNSGRSRCKEGGEHENNELLINWGKSLWVST